MDISLNKRKENGVTIIDFIDHFGDKIGQLVYEIINNKAIIHDTFIYPDYRNKGVLKTHFPDILSTIKQNDVCLIELSVLSGEARLIWNRLGFTEDKPNFFVMNI
jgi:hypothetical protein